MAPALTPVSVSISQFESTSFKIIPGMPTLVASFQATEGKVAMETETVKIRHSPMLSPVLKRSLLLYGV